MGLGWTELKVKSLTGAHMAWIVSPTWREQREAGGASSVVVAP